jgi:hypothetical protein
MTDAIPATFAKFQQVSGRKVLQLVFEVPIEAAKQAFDLLGYPTPGTESWVAIAPLKHGPEAKPRKQFHELPLPQQAGIKCADIAFQEFLGDMGPIPLEGQDGVEWAAQNVREICGIDSRAELATNPEAAERWRNILREFAEHG